MDSDLSEQKVSHNDAAQGSPVPDAVLHSFAQFLRDSSADVPQFIGGIGGFQVLFNVLVADPEDGIVRAVVDKVCTSPHGHTLLSSAELQQNLLLGLSHPKEEIRIVTLKALGHLLSSVEGVKYLLSPTMFGALVQLLVDPSSGVAEEAARFIAILCSSSAGAALFFSPETTQKLEGARKDLVVGFRLITLAIEIASSSSPSTDLFRSSVYAQELLSFIGKSDDVMIQLNALEAISRFLSQEFTFTIANEASVVRRICDLLSSDDPVLVVSALSFIEDLTKASKKFSDDRWIQEDELHKKFLELIDSSDERILASCISAICALSGTPRGLQFCAHSTSPRQPGLLLQLPEHLFNSSDLVKMAVLHGLSNFFGHGLEQGVKEPQGLRDVQISVCGALSERYFDRLQQFLQEPFEEQRLVCFRLIAALAKHSFGLEAVCSRGGLLEFLLNRKTETTKTGMEWKFEIVKTIFHSSSFASVSIHASYKQRLEEYAKQGPFYVKREAAVLTESM